MKKLTVVGVAAVVLVFLSVVVMNIAKSPAQAVAKQASTTPISMDGHWKQTKGGLSNTVMTADISGGSIKIQLMMGDVSGLYWDGSFVPGVTNSFTVESNATSTDDPKGMLESRSSTKVFTYKDGDLSYEFTMLGTTTIVHLARS